MEKELHIPQSDIKIPRDKMPQITAQHMPHFLHDLHKKGFKSGKTHVKVGHLKPTQSNFNHDMIKKLIHHPMPEDERKKRPILISKDHYIIDGHHRALADLNKHGHDHKTEVMKVHMNAKELLHHAKNYKHAEFRTDTSKLTNASEEFIAIKNLVRKLLNS